MAKKTRATGAVLTFSLLAACSSGGPLAHLNGVNGVTRGSPYAPPVDHRGETVDQMLVGHRLLASGQAELALESFRRAAAEKGLTGEVLSAMGTANIALGRLGQAEKLLRRAIKADADSPEVWNNLGVVLIEQGKTGEAARTFQKAYALDNGESDSIRDNLRIALAKIDAKGYGEEVEEQQMKLIRRGSSDYLIRSTGV